MYLYELGWKNYNYEEKLTAKIKSTILTTLVLMLASVMMSCYGSGARGV